MRATFFQKHPILKDILSFGSFVLCVVVGTLLLNSFVFRSYNVVGSSMEDTLLDGDRVIVNRLAVTLDHFSGEEYVPKISINMSTQLSPISIFNRPCGKVAADHKEKRHVHSTAEILKIRHPNRTSHRPINMPKRHEKHGEELQHIKIGISLHRSNNVLM